MYLLSMALSVNHSTKIIDSTTSITDVVAFKEELRTLESNTVWILYQEMLTFAKLDLWWWSFQYWVDLINGYQLRFNTPWNYTILWNINATIVPVAWVFVDRTKSIAFVNWPWWSWWGWLTQQQVRDAMTLAPTLTPQAWSIDKILQTLKNFILVLLAKK